MGVLPLVFIAGGVFAMNYLTSLQEPPKPEEKAAQALLVSTISVQPTSYTYLVPSQGTVEPTREIALTAEVGGKLVEVSGKLNEGEFFQKGDVLARIESTDYALAAVQARSAIAQSELRLATEEAQAQLAREEWERLGKGEPTDLVLRKPQLAEVTATLNAAKAALSQAERSVHKTVLRAPFDGRVRRKLVDFGQVVGPGTPLAQIYAIDEVQVRLPLTNDEAAYVDLPLHYADGSSSTTPPEVQLSARFAGKAHQWTGLLTRTEGEIDPRTRMIQAVALVAKPFDREEHPERPPLAVGLYVEANIVGRSVENVYLIPRTAVRNGNQVLIVDSEGKLRYREITIARLERDLAVVTDGLQPGEQLCVSNIEKAVDGMSVKAIAATPTASSSATTR